MSCITFLGIVKSLLDYLLKVFNNILVFCQVFNISELFICKVCQHMLLGISIAHYITRYRAPWAWPHNLIHLSNTFSWLFHNLFTTCSQLVENLFMNGLQPVNNFFTTLFITITCLWLAHDLCKAKFQFSPVPYYHNCVNSSRIPEMGELFAGLSLGAVQKLRNPLRGRREVTKRLHKITRREGVYTKRSHGITNVKLVQP